jgi:transcriptional regulator with XRE-family HTH domain
MTVNQNIRIKRKERNFTLAYVAEKTGTSASMLSRYESGVIRYVPNELLHRIAKVLDCDPADLTRGDERYAQSQKKRVPSNTLSSEEYEMILHYRKLPANVQSLIKEVCFSHISITTQ